MTPDETLCRWAERRWSLEGVTAVEIDHQRGWLGSGVTPGYPEEITVTVTLEDGSKKTVEDELVVSTDLIREILASAGPF